MEDLEVVLDCETNGLLHHFDKLHLVSYCYREPDEVLKLGYKFGYIPLKMKLGDWLPDGGATQVLIDILQNKIQKNQKGDEYRLVPVFHNAAYDIEVLKAFGFPEPTVFHDTLIAGWLLMPTVDEEEVLTRSLKTDKYVKHRSKYSLAAWGKRLGLKHQKFETPSFEEYSEELEVYGVQDAVSQHELKEYILPRLRADKKAWKLYQQIEIPYVAVIRRLQMAGLHFDLDKLGTLKEELERKQAEIDGRIQELVGLIPLGTWSKTINPKNEDDITDNAEDAIEGMFKFYGKEVDSKDGRERYTYRKWVRFSANSSNHKRFALECLYGFKSSKRTQSGKEAIDKEVLKSLDFPLAKMLSEYSVYEKLLSTYIRKFIDSGGKMYGDWIQYGTVTGRISSRSPNFQNLPARGELGEAIRDAVIPREDDRVLVAIDLDQIELRVLAWFLIRMFGEELDEYPDAATMWNCFHDGGDPHQMKADEANISRRDAKTFNFGDLFGFGAEKAAGIIGCTVAQAKEMLDKWRASTPATQELKKRVWREAEQNKGILHTLYGRRLVYPDICIPFIPWEVRQSGKMMEWQGQYFSADVLSSRKAEAQRQIFNAMIQGTAADIFKILANRATPRITAIDGIPILNVHDEYVADVSKKHAEQVKHILNGTFCMEPKDSLLPGLPITAEAKIGRSWKEAK